MQYQELIDFQIVQTVNTNPSAINHPAPSTDQTVNNEESKSANWKTYSNTQQGFTIKYPNGVEIKGEGDGAVLLTLSGPTQKSGSGFYDGIFLRFHEFRSCHSGLSKIFNRSWMRFAYQDDREPKLNLIYSNDLDY